MLALRGHFFKVIKATVGLRVSEEEELNGLDVSEHAEEGYPDFQQIDTVHLA
jgi:ammonium transporter, Amt family